MIRVYFVNNNKRKKRLIAEVQTVDEVYAEINKFLTERNFVSYYQRLIQTDKGTRIDVGSWSEFFDVEGISFRELCEYVRK